MAKQGMVPVFAVYSSFLQRGYDMLIHDVAIQHLHVIFGRRRVLGQDIGNLLGVLAKILGHLMDSIFVQQISHLQLRGLRQ